MNLNPLNIFRSKDPSRREGRKRLVLESELGTVSIPDDMRSARLNGKLFDADFGDTHIRINKKALKGILCEINGGEIFRAMERRFFVVAKVGRIHVPFYISSEGTSGKRQGEWYPFFGYTGDWMVKGRVSSSGDMTYHQEITKVQKILNENLLIPVSKISLKGRAGPDRDDHNEPTQVLFDINKHLKYKALENTDEYKKRSKQESDPMLSAEYVASITGYKPDRKKIGHASSVANDWIEEIVKKI